MSSSVEVEQSSGNGFGLGLGPQESAAEGDPMAVYQSNGAIAPAEQGSTSDVAVVKVEVPTSPQATSSNPQQYTCHSLLVQMNQLGPSDRCTPSQAQSMGQELLSIIAYHERNKLPIPVELHNSFDIFHRCLAVVYGTFFVNLYLKANAPCLLCHGCKSLYPPGQFIHHMCPALPPNIVPCRSRMWRRCLVPLVSPGVDKLQQKHRWKYVIEKFSHVTAGGVRRNPIPPSVEAQLLEMPECKRGRFVKAPKTKMNGMEVEEVMEGDEEEQSPTEQEDSPQQLLLEVDNEEVEGEEDQVRGGRRLSVEGMPPNHSPTPPTHPQYTTDAVGLAEQLLREVKSLQRELLQTRARMAAGEEAMKKMPSEAAMREQLAQALASQQVLKAERDQAVEQCRLAQAREQLLQQQLDRLKASHAEMERLFHA